MSFDDAQEILLLNLEGKFRGERSKLIEAVDVVCIACGEESRETVLDAAYGGSEFEVEYYIEFGGES